MALEKIMPDDMNEVMRELLAYIGDEDKQAGAKMSYGDFGKLLAKNYGRYHIGVSGPDKCSIEATRQSIRIKTVSGNEYELTWNKIAKFIHPYLKSAAVSETGEGTMQRMNESTKITDTKLTASTKAAIKERFPYAVTLGDLKQCISEDPTTLDCFTPRTVDIIMNILDFNDYDSPAVKQDTPTDTAAFDYSAVDDDTAQYLRKATARIANSYADIGAVLAEAQERLAKHGFGENNGVFEKWCNSLGMPKRTAYRFIQIHNFRNNMLRSCQNGTNEDALEIFDNLPKTLQADISAPSAPAEAVNAVLSGDITTHKDFIALKKRIEELTEELDKADDWNEELTEERDKLKKDLERSESDARIVSTNYDKLREDYEELGDKNAALELELKEARSQPQDAAIIPDPTESEEYKAILDERDDLIRQNNELMTRQPIVTGGYDPEQLKEFFEDYYEAAYKAVRAVYIFVREDYPQEIKNYVRNRVNDLRNYIEDLEDIHEDDF